MIFTSREDMIAMTPQWKGERFEDGRPKVAERYLDALYGMTLEELWKPIFVQGYECNFIAMKSLHPEFREDGSVYRKLVGRAVTAMYAPSRPDYAAAMFSTAKERGLSGTPNQWVIDSLQSRDVLVIDMFDKVYKGTFLGGNLTTAVHQKTGNGGAVIWGGIRDVEQMQQVPDIQVYYRGIDPTPIREFVMLGMNRPARIGDGRDAAICLPGDVVFGCGGGVLFIPPHLAAEVVEGGAVLPAVAREAAGCDAEGQHRGEGRPYPVAIHEAGEHLLEMLRICPPRNDVSPGLFVVCRRRPSGGLEQGFQVGIRNRPGVERVWAPPLRYECMDGVIRRRHLHRRGPGRGHFDLPFSRSAPSPRLWGRWSGMGTRAGLGFPGRKTDPRKKGPK